MTFIAAAVTVPHLVVIAAVAGVVSHKLYWCRYEFDEQVPKILLGAILTFIAIVLMFSRTQSITAANYIALELLSAYVLALFCSISTYRILFHPLRRFPGPFWARLSAWWRVKSIAQEGPYFAMVGRLHESYGEIVRIGPNNLSICNVETLDAIYSSQSQCTKPPSYLIGGLVSVQSERNPHRHRLRRAIWDKALGTNASNLFYPRLSQMVDLMLHRLDSFDGQAVSVNDWMHFLTFDVMAQFCFSRDWNQLKTAKMHPGIAFASDYLRFAVLGSQLPWLAISLMRIPFAPEPQSAMMEFASKALDERASGEPPIPDAMSYILREKNPEAQQFLSKHDLESDVFMIMLAGADTSFSVLVNLCFRIAFNARYVEQLREELTSAFNVDDEGHVEVDWPKLSSAPFLAALVNETLRLHPPVPSGMPRVTPQEGLLIPVDSTTSPQDRFIRVPGSTIVSVPTAAIHRSERYWIQPDTFIPERWTTKPDLILDKRAWCPFSMGTYGCAGKYFALMEIKLALARLVMAFDLRPEEQLSTEEQEAWLTRQDDHMTLQPDDLRLKFVRRQITVIDKK